jgi:hypothetical protein
MAAVLAFREARASAEAEVSAAAQQNVRINSTLCWGSPSLRIRRRIEDETCQPILLIKHQDGESFGEIRWRLKAPISQVFIGPENQVVVILKGLSAIRARKYMHDLPAILFYRAKKMHGARFADSCLWVLPRAGKLEIARCTGSQVAVRQLEIIHRPIGTCDDVHRTETVHGATEVCAVIVGFVVIMQNLFRGGSMQRPAAVCRGVR